MLPLLLTQSEFFCWPKNQNGVERAISAEEPSSLAGMAVSSLQSINPPIGTAEAKPAHPKTKTKAIETKNVFLIMFFTPLVSNQTKKVKLCLPLRIYLSTAYMVISQFGDVFLRFWGVF